jgi:hypothetical protein
MDREAEVYLISCSFTTCSSQYNYTVLKASTVVFSLAGALLPLLAWSGLHISVNDLKKNVRTIWYVGLYMFRLEQRTGSQGCDVRCMALA